tara:strand:+ start:672 stop:1481 length:810 start_codon:yes stop_codon:yes gene_type:complete
MKLFKNKKELQKEIKNINNISFVPTMGSLHKGHESLIRKSVKRSKKTLVSIFVNPKQFEDKKDFKNYPANFNKDIKLLKKLKVNYIYKPTYKDIYKFKTKNKPFLDQFSNKLCGKFRKSHFRGVVDVVNRFLEIIKPEKIFLGNKDFQQLILIKKHIIKNKINTKIIACETIRDKNYIAYSSRLKLLKKNDKTKLNKIIRHLKIFKRNLISNKIKYDFSKIRRDLVSLGVKKIDYIEILDLKTLKKPKKSKFNIFFAFYIGKIRFIDNF